MNIVVDLHIEYEANCYDGDWLTSCKVTYPMKGISPSHPPITVDYHDAEDDAPELPLKRMAEDIKAFLSNPDAWVRNYITRRSTSIGMKLEQAKRNVDQYRERIASLESNLTYNQHYLTEAQAQVAALQAKIEQTK